MSEHAIQNAKAGRLCTVPVTLREAQSFVAQVHRHHAPSVGHKFSIGAARDGEIVAVAMVGRPVSRHADDGWTLEVNRLAAYDDDRGRHACSFLYGAAWRAAKALGYKRLITYTLPHEGGASLRAAGWTLIGEAGGGSWSCKSRPRVDIAPTQVKLRWEKP